MRKLFLALGLLLLFFCAPAAHAQCDGAHPLYAAHTANQSDVQLCLNLTHNCDDLIYVPPGSATWTTLHLTNPPTGCQPHHGVRLYGSTVVTVTGDGTSASAIGDTNSTCNPNINACIILAATGDGHGFNISGCTPTSYCEVGNITFTVTVPSTNGQIAFTTQLGTGGARFHNFHLINNACNTGSACNGGSPMWFLTGPALVDNFLLDDIATLVNGNGVVVKGSGYASWSENSNFGGPDAVFVEQFRMNFSLGNGDGLCDLYSGGSVTMRHGYANNFQGCGDHGYDSGPFRGALRKELYNMTLVCGSGPLGNNRGGSYYDFNNTFINGLATCTSHSLQYYRQSNAIPQEITPLGAAGTTCPGCQWTPISAVPDGAGSLLNTLNASDFIAGNAYPANATVGPRTNNTGKNNFQLRNGPRTSGTVASWSGTPPGSTLTDSAGGIWFNIGGTTDPSPAPNVAAGFLSTNPDTPCSSGPTCTYFVDNPNGTRFLRDQPGVIGGGQRPFPAYAFHETNPPANVFLSTDSVSAVNRDFYNPAPSFNGTVGTGSGTFTAIPPAASCVTGTAYFATDQGPQGTLYQCQNHAWVSYYQPYTYPHPEQTPPCLNRMFTNWSGGTAGNAPTAATMNASTHGFNFGTWSSQATDMTYAARSDMGLSAPTGTLCLDNTNWPGTENLAIVRTGAGVQGVSSIHYSFSANANTPVSASVCFISDIQPGGNPAVDIFYLGGTNSSGTHDVVNITFVSTSPKPTFNIETQITGGNANAIPYTPGTLVTLTLQYNRVSNSRLMVRAGCGGNGALLGDTGPVGVMGGTVNPDHITIGSQGGNQQLNVGNHIWYSVPQVSLDGAIPMLGAGSGGPVANLSPGGINFGIQPPSQVTSPQTITITNNGTTNLTWPSFSTTSPANTTFTASPGSCPFSNSTGLAPGASCTVSITGVTTAVGPQTGTFNLPSNAPGSPQTIQLSMTGASSPGVTLCSSLSFNGVNLAVTSPAMVCTVTSSGSGSLLLSIPVASITGTNATNFALTSPTGACSDGQALAPASTCTLNVTFTPSAAGNFTATLNLFDNVTGSPQTVPLTGVGISVAAASWMYAQNQSGCKQALPLTPTWCFTGDGHIYFSSCTPLTCSPFAPYTLTVSASTNGVAQ